MRGFLFGGAVSAPTQFLHPMHRKPEFTSKWRKRTKLAGNSILAGLGRV